MPWLIDTVLREWVIKIWIWRDDVVIRYWQKTLSFLSFKILILFSSWQRKRRVWVLPRQSGILGWVSLVVSSLFKGTQNLPSCQLEHLPTCVSSWSRIPCCSIPLVEGSVSGALGIPRSPHFRCRPRLQSFVLLPLRVRGRYHHGVRPCRRGRPLLCWAPGRSSAAGSRR